MAKSQIRQYVFTPGASLVGTIKVPGKYDLSQILLITNTTKNAIIYNFADATFNGTLAQFTRATDTNFVTGLDNTDGYTTITLKADTSFATTGMTANDQIQILYEKPYMDVRMPEIGTDAFERTRVSTPQSMLDADFEYGLQPTKWQTIDLIRGYPSVYEVPGQDYSVSTVTTDASYATNGLGASLITITTPSVHGLTAGTPITVKGFLNTILGFSRAEGTFNIFSVPTTTTLTYYAKSKVGTNNGDIISSTYTQLRKGGYYTGASVGSPTFTYANAATTATSTASTIGTSNQTYTVTIAANSTSLTTSGGTPAIGQVLSGGNITPGTYITAGSGTSWTVSTPQLTATTSTTITATTNTFTAGGTIATNTFAVGQVLSGTGVATGTAIIALGGGTGGAGTYFVNIAQTVGSTAINASTAAATITVTFAAYHGFVPGDTILTTVSTDNGTNNHQLAAGPFYVETVSSPTTLTFTARLAGAITGVITGVVYARPDAFYQHRPFDGGVILGTGGPQYGTQAIRQSKKYIRYQSGKAINYNTGALFAPNYDIRSITASGTTTGSTITIVTDDVDHGCQVGATIVVTGVSTAGYNGTYTVNSIVDERTLTVLSNLTNAPSGLGSTTGVIGTPCLLSVKNWTGSVVRAGTFDDQNGMWWQFDGTQFAIGRRSSTFQVAGSVSVSVDNNLVTGSNTRFTSQITAGDRIVIRGMTHVVSAVNSDTSLNITPDYRGAVSATSVKVTKVIDYIVPQSQWNLDRCDGTNSPFNPSGYLIDQSKMQMIGMQWTWYGAGFIDWMLRGPEGKYITVHRLRNNNLNKEAYMRTGNMPVRYEVLNEGARSSLTATALSGDTTLSVADLTYFPTAGTVYVDNEFITYTGKGASTGAGNLTGCQRAQPLTQFTGGSNRSFTAGIAASHSSGAGVIQVNQSATPNISHWGSAFITDGQFDQDRGYIFNYQALNVSISTKKTTAFAIRLAPSVSNAIIGDLGVRELINRAQLLLQGIEITAGGSTNANSALVVEGVLNPSNYPTNTANITWNSLSSLAIPTGQPSFAQIANGATVTFDNAGSVATTVPVGLAPGTTILPVASLTSVQVSDDLVNNTSASFAGGTKVVTPVVSTPTFTGTTVTAATGVTSANATISGTTFTAAGIPTGGAAAFSIGQVLTGSGVAANTYIVAGPLTGTANAAGATWTVSVNQTVTATTITGTLYTFAPTAITGTILPGMLLTGGSVTAGTYVIAGNAQNPALTGTGSNSGGTYALNQTFSNTPTGGSINYVTLNQATTAVTTYNASVTFSRNTYAAPGETVFSFIAGQSGRDALDLSPLKELTSTPIGGRGTFPNGPDVLFINVYLTQGSPILSNLVLRWGEAQA